MDDIELYDIKYQYDKYYFVLYRMELLCNNRLFNMKNLLPILFLLLCIYSCSENKSRAHINRPDKDSIRIEFDTIPNLPNSEIYEGKGYILSPKIAIYNSSLKQIDYLSIDEDVAQINILEKTRNMVTASGDTIDAPCPTAYFLKIKYKDKEAIVYGIDIYEPIKKESFNFKNDINSISLYAIENFSIGFSGFGELTGCDDYHPLIVFENNRFHKIYTIPRKDFDYYAKNNNLNYYYLVSDDGVREKISNVSLNRDTIIAKIYVEYQDGHSDYNLNIIKNNGIFESTISNETGPSFD